MPVSIVERLYMKVILSAVNVAKNLTGQTINRFSKKRNGAKNDKKNNIFIGFGFYAYDHVFLW